MIITLIEIHDYKRLQDVTIEPGERNLILVGGNNTHGKSSLIGAMGAALGGKREVPEDPIRHGAENASIRIEFDSGSLVVRRKFTKKSTTIEVTSDGKVLKSPQKILDDLVGARFIDPMKFSRLPAKEQREVILGCVELSINLDENIESEKEAYQDRRDINRDIKKLKAAWANYTPEPLLEEIKPAKFQEEIDRLNNLRNSARDADREISDLRSRERAAKEVVNRAQRALSEARDNVAKAREGLTRIGAEITEKIDGLLQVSDSSPSEEKIEAAKVSLKECLDRNGEAAMATAEAKAFDQSKDELNALQVKSDGKSSEIEALRDTRSEALAIAKMPIPGLSFDGDGLQLNGAPFEQASGAEKLRASIAISWALKPELQDIWVEDGALLDEISLEMVREFAKENGLRVWLERVGEGDEEAIIMVDGSVKQ